MKLAGKGEVCSANVLSWLHLYLGVAKLGALERLDKWVKMNKNEQNMIYTGAPAGSAGRACNT